MSERIPAYEGREPYIFVSYAHRNSEKVMPCLLYTSRLAAFFLRQTGREVVNCKTESMYDNIILPIL